MIIEITGLADTSVLWEVIKEIDDAAVLANDIRIANEECMLLANNDTITLIYDMTSRTIPREDFDDIHLI